MYERGLWSCTLNGKATVSLSSIFEKLEFYLGDNMIHTIDRHKSLVRDGCITIHQEGRPFPNVKFRLGRGSFPDDWNGSPCQTVLSERYINSNHGIPQKQTELTFLEVWFRPHLYIQTLQVLNSSMSYDSIHLKNNDWCKRHTDMARASIDSAKELRSRLVKDSDPWWVRAHGRARHRQLMMWIFHELREICEEGSDMAKFRYTAKFLADAGWNAKTKDEFKSLTEDCLSDLSKQQSEEQM